MEPKPRCSHRPSCRLQHACPLGFRHQVPAEGHDWRDPTRCEEIMREVCADFEAELKQFNGEQDHVHLLVHYPPKVQLSKLVNSLKGVSARLLRKEYDSHVRRYLWGGRFWSGSYFAGLMRRRTADCRQASTSRTRNGRPETTSPRSRSELRRFAASRPWMRARPHGSEGGQPERELFGKLADGTKVYRWSLANGGTRLKVLSYGGIVQSLEIPDRHGRYKNVSLGFDSLEEYVASSPYFGALIGRYGNRIARGKFTLDGKAYQVSVNDGENSLHGGSKGFDKRVWDVESFTSGSDIGLFLHYTSVDGEMGYPGTLRVKMTYTLTRRGDWRVDYAATTDKATVVNLTSHVYWNLAGEDGGSVYDHELSIGASRYTPVDSGSSPPANWRGSRARPSTTAGPRPSVRTSGQRTSSCCTARATTTTGFWTRAARTRPSRSPRCATRPRAVSWTSRRPSPACSSTPATSWTEHWSARAAPSTARATPCVWRPSTSRTPPTSRPSRPRSCGPATPTAPRRCTDSLRADRQPPLSVPRSPPSPATGRGLSPGGGSPRQLFRPIRTRPRRVSRRSGSSCRGLRPTVK